MNRFLISSLHRLGLIDFAINRKIGDYKPSWNRIKSDGWLDLPFYLNFIITQRCNLNCIMCHESGNVKSKERELSTDQVFKTIENAGAITVAAIQGGEICLRKDLWEILDFMDNKGIRLKITTNATLIDEQVVARIVRLKHVENVAVSIDGPEQIHNTIRRKNDAFQRTIAAVRLFKANGLPVSVTSVLLPENCAVIEETLGICLSLGVDRVSVLPFTYRKRSEEEVVEAMFPGHSLCLPEQPEGYLPFTTEQLASVNRAIARYRAKGLLCTYYPPFVGKFTKEYAAERPIPGTFVCKQFYQVFLNERGDLFPCPFLTRNFGNVHETPVAELWNSEELRNFRKKLACGNMLPVCRRCCALHRV